MKKTSLKLASLALVILMVACLLATISSCSKSNPNAPFLGIYAGNTTFVSTGSYGPDTVTISAGGTSDAIVIVEKKYGASVTGTVAGTSLTIPTQTISISGGNYPVSGRGALSGNALTITFTETILGVNYNIVFSGSK
jgi:hypothetical protein